MRHPSFVSLLRILLLWPALAICQTSSAPAAAPASTPAGRDQQCQDILNKALMDKNPDTRMQAAIALSLVGSTEPFPSELESLLDDKDVEVRLSAISSLSEVKNSRTVPALHKALNDEVPEVSFAAARALWALKDPDGKKALLSIVSGETKPSSGYFAKQKRDALRMMHTPRTMFLFAVKQGAGLAPVPGLGEGVSSMEALLSDPSVSGRATAVLLLEKDNDPETLAALKDALTDKVWSVRAAGVHALVTRDQPAFESDIIPLLDDKTEAVRLRAAAGYLRLEAVKNAPKRAPSNTRKRPAKSAAAPKSQS
jgi:HEAT repeat protein